ncbi:C6 zinc finger domain-containing protein [Fusarium oxysporum f. sp. phaseoli]
MSPQTSEMSAEADRRPGKRPAPRGTAFYPRKRANTACQVCRARKTKCDNQKPACSYCVSVGATCIQSPVDLSAFDPASLKILERLDELEKLIREPKHDTTNQDVAQHETELLPEESPTQLSPESLGDIPLRSILPEKMESLLLWSVLSRDMSSHTTLHPDPPQPSPSYSPGCTSLADIADLDTQGVKALLDNFFDHVHCKNPILEEAAARKVVLNVVIDGIDWSPGSCLTLIICSGAFSGGAEEDWDVDGEIRYYWGAVFLSFGRVFDEHVQTIRGLARAQSLSAMDGSDLARPELGETQQEAVYWSAWKSERELRGELSLPDFSMPYSSSVLYPPFFPTPPHPLESTKTTASSRQHTAWLFYLSEISLRRLSSRTCNDILELHRASSSNLDFLKQLSLLIPAYETQANEWAESLPPELSIASTPLEDNVCCFVLRGHLVNFFERLYWPFVMAHLAALERGVTTPIPGRQFVEKGLEYHVLNVEINEAGFLHRHHGTWLMIRALVRSATVLLAARLLGSGMPAGWRDACERIMQVLRAWEDDVPGLSNHRNFLEEVLHGLSV